MSPEDIFTNYQQHAKIIENQNEITRNKISYLIDNRLKLFFYDNKNKIIYTYYWEDGYFTLSILLDIINYDIQSKDGEIASLIEIEYDFDQDDISSELYLSNYDKIRSENNFLPDVIDTGSKTITYLISIAKNFYINRIFADDQSELICNDCSKVSVAITRLIAGYDTLYVKLGFIPEDMNLYTKLKKDLSDLGNIPIKNLGLESESLSKNNTNYTLASYLRDFLNGRIKNLCPKVSNIINDIKILNHLYDQKHIISVYYISYL